MSRLASPRKRGRPRDESLTDRRREEILDAAVAVFARHGYPHTDVQSVADALGVGKGTVYRYFPSKQELFLAAVDRGMRRMSERVKDRVDAVPQPLDKVAQAIRTYLAFFGDHPEYVELLIQERAEFKDRERQTYFVHRDANLPQWADLFRGLMDQGHIRRVPVDRIMDVLSDLVYGTMFTNYFAGRSKDPDTQAEDLLDIVLHGILLGPQKGRGESARRGGRA